MDLRLALYEIAATHRLDARATEQLHRLAGFRDEPLALSHWLPRAMAIVAAALGGLGLIFWLAANWDTLGRFGRFALLEACVLVTCVAALWRVALSAPSGLLAFLSIGGLFAYFGQTYQTGADPWQLFALWAALAIPLCLGVRSDVLWAPWALVVVSAISLWVHAHTGHRWRVQPDDVHAYLFAWVAAFVLAAVLSEPVRRFTGAGVWALRTALTLSVVMITVTSLGELFRFDDRTLILYSLGIGVFAAGAVGLALPKTFDVYGLSVVALGINTLVIAGLARLLFKNHHGGDPIGPLLLIGLAAAGLLAGSVSGVLRISRRHGSPGQPS